MTDNVWQRINKPKEKQVIRYQFLTGDFDVYMSNQEYKSPLAYPTHYLKGPKDNLESVKIKWTFDLLNDALQPVLRQIRAIYGGTWELIVDDHREIPVPFERDNGTNRKKAEQAILAGPDNLSKQFMQRIRQVANKMTIPDSVKGQSPRADNIVEDLPF